MNLATIIGPGIRMLLPVLQLFSLPEETVFN
jgi:hypothetical protein